MSEVPEAVRRLAAEREDARRDKDFVRADALRDRIRELGYEVTDKAGGTELAARTTEPQAASPVYERSEEVPSVLDESPSFDGPSVQWVMQGWPDDLVRSYRSVTGTLPGDFQPIIVEAAGMESALDWYRGEQLHVAPEAGWGLARNAGLRRVASEVVILLDSSIEFTANGVAQLWEAAMDPTVGVTGPFGLVTDDMHEFHESEGPDVDAIEGHVMAFRRELLEQGIRFDEKFRFYRHADIDLSFRIKAMGLRARVTPVSVVRHEHRMWTNTPEAERDRLSKRNFYRFLDRWRDRTDLLVGRRNP